MVRAFREAVRLEHPGGQLQILVLRTPHVAQIPLKNGHFLINVHEERNPIDKLRVFREIEPDPVETPEAPVFDELTGHVEMRSPVFDALNAAETQRKTREASE